MTGVTPARELPVYALENERKQYNSDCNFLSDDPRVIAGGSGAVTSGSVVSLMKNDRLEDARATLGLDQNSRVLLISTD